MLASSKAQEELTFWKENVRSVNENSFTDTLVMDKSIFPDPGGAGFGGSTFGIPDSEMVVSWSEHVPMLS